MSNGHGWECTTKTGPECALNLISHEMAASLAAELLKVKDDQDFGFAIREVFGMIDLVEHSSHSGILPIDAQYG